jgi:hypothetical protein
MFCKILVFKFFIFFYPNIEALMFGSIFYLFYVLVFGFYEGGESHLNIEGREEVISYPYYDNKKIILLLMNYI